VNLRIAIVIGQFLGLAAWAQAQPDALELSSSNAPSEGPPLPPPMALAKAPVTFFRELLAMTPVQRREALTNRAPDKQKAILAKVREYGSLNKEQRELRLAETELQWFLLPLLKSPATNRAMQLASVPEADRKAVEARLALWDRLPAVTQIELLDNYATVRYLTELRSGTNSISAEREAMLNKGIAQLQAMPEPRRRRLLARFGEFFTLTAEEKGQALHTLSEAERRQIERTLRNFGSLDPIQRTVCLRSFEKFASLSLDEREQFLRNADRWKGMKPQERQAWIELVDKFPQLPPAPPGMVPMPPSPPGLNPAAAPAPR
jgi:Protein of unknown function (DUF3106)